MTDSVTPNETPVSAAATTDGESTAKAAVGSLRRLLRAKMAIVLQTRPRFLLTEVTKVRADKLAQALYKQFTELPLLGTDSEREVQTYLETSTDCYRQYFAASQAAKEAKEACAEAEFDWYRATRELSEACKSAAGNAQLAEDDVYLAAKQMLSQAPVPRTVPTEPKTVEVVMPEATADQPALMVELNVNLLSAAKLTASAFKFGPQLIAAAHQLTQKATPEVKEPVRPTEEEIQRYLRELEQGVDARQNAHWQMDDLLRLERVLEQESVAATEALIETMVKVDALPQCHKHVDVKAPMSTSGQVTSFGPKALTVFHEYREKNWSGLVRWRLAHASSREKRQVEELRKMIRQLAVIMAHLNESTTACSAARRVPTKEVHLTGVAEDRTTWAECLAWRVGKDQEQEAANRKNESRKSKLELLEEAVERYQRDKKDAVKELRRYLLSILPPEDRPPCDELRKVMNMASIMVTPDRGGYDRKTGDYPVY